MFRPEGLHPADDGPVRATVVGAFYRGGHHLVRVQLPDGARVLVRSSVSMSPGTEIALRADEPALVPAVRAWRPDPTTLKVADPSLRWSAERYSANNELGTLLAQAAGLALLAARAAAVV